MDLKWAKYSFVCNGECDALIEYTFKDGFGWPNGVIKLSCPCGSDTTLLSVEDATINTNNNKQKEAPMDQSTLEVNATEDFLKSQIVAKDERIQQLEEHVQRVTQRDYTTAGNLQAMRDSMHEWTLEALAQREISETNAEEIAEICGFELTKEVEVEVTVTYNLTLMVPHDGDAEDIVNDIDFESVSYNSDNVTWLSASVDRIDI